MDLKNGMEENKNQYTKFQESCFREYQPDAIETILESKKRVQILCLPTGAGKSLIGVVGLSMGGGGIYMVHSKPLQVQLQDDFTTLPILWGRGNYKCLGRANEGLSCDECTHSRFSPCQYKEQGCEYHEAKKRALRSHIAILNYDYWMTESNYIGRFDGRNIVVVDEADSLEGTISRFISLEFSDGMLAYLKVGLPKYKTTSSKNAMEDWKGWAGFCVKRVDGIIADLSRAISRDIPDPDILKRIARMSRIRSKLIGFIDYVDETWLFEVREYAGRKTIIFKPCWISENIAEHFVWSHGDRFVLMSATFPPIPVLAKTLGLPMADIGYKQYPSVFKAENRQVIMRPVANLTYKTMEDGIRRVTNEIRELLGNHKEEKGLIHTVSYKLTDAIMDIGDDRLITHNGANKIQVLEEFKKSERPLVLVSPSSERGVSFDDDMCRWVVWAKAPYLNLSDKLVSARIYKSHIGNLWYKSDMLMTVVQGSGRAVRNENDHAITYILDEQICRVIKDNPSMVPMWFREALW